MTDDGVVVLFAVVGARGFQLVTGDGTVVFETPNWRQFRRCLGTTGPTSSPSRGRLL